MTKDVDYGPLSNLAGQESQDEHLRGASTRALLRVLEIDYTALLQRLSLRVGSKEAAAEALHDTYIKLRSGPDIGQVRSDRAYLYRMALNLARNRRRNEARIVPFATAAFVDLPDAAPSQERVVAAEQEVAFAITALRSMPLKRQKIFLAKWRDNKSQAEIAAEFGMHKRSVQKELAKAEASIRAILRSHMVI